MMNVLYKKHLIYDEKGLHRVFRLYQLASQSKVKVCLGLSASLLVGIYR